MGLFRYLFGPKGVDQAEALDSRTKFYRENRASETLAAMPHCDSTILHAPGSCGFCDLYPQRQEDRVTQRINFTGESEPDKAPCPSEYFRPPELRDRWPGNRAVPIRRMVETPSNHEGLA